MTNKKKDFGDILNLADDFFANIKIISYPSYNIKIDAVTTVIDIDKAVKSELSCLKKHNGNKYFIPSLKRLYGLKNAIVNNCDISINIDYILKNI